MSHFGIQVCLAPGSETDWPAAVASAMEPYRIDDETGLGEWDHWHSSGDFRVRPEHVDDPFLVPSSQWPADPLRCDGGPKRALELIETTFALLAVDGRWFDIEQTPDYEAVARAYLDALPDDTFVIELDCHS